MSKVKRYFLILPILCIALIPCTSVFVSAVDYTFEYDISEPVSSEFTGYIVIPYTDGQGHFYDTCYFWVITPTLGTDNVLPVVSWNYSSSNNSFNLVISTNQTGYTYFISLYSISSGGTIIHQYSDNVSYSHAYSYSRTYSSNYTVLRPQFKNISVIGDWPTSTLNYDILWSADNKIYNELVYIEFRLLDLINGLDLTNEQLEQTYSLLSDYLEKIYLLDRSIEDTLTWLYDEFYWWSFEVAGNQARIIELLEQLIEGTEEFSESSTLSDEQNELNRVEDELLNNEEASNAQDDIKVEVNANAMSYIWDLITQFLNSHPKIMGMVITILSLGIIALILNR